MSVKKGQQVELFISEMAFGGKGLARLNGYAVFVDQTVPADRIIARIVKKKKNFAEARVVDLLEPSPHRITPPCPYSGFCGGCKWQFVTYDKQLDYKRQHVADSLAHIGGIQGVTVHPTIPSHRQYGYRNKMEFTCSDRRWLLPDEMTAGEEIQAGFALGLHVPGTYYKVLDTKACLLQPEVGNQILDEIRDYIRASGLPVYGLRSHLGFWRFVMLRHSVSGDCWMVNIVTAVENERALRPLVDRLEKKFPQVVSIINNVTARKAGIALGEYEVCLSGSPVLSDQIGGYRFKISANSFFQTNTLGAEKLYGVVKEYAGLTGAEAVVDMYCGTGTIAICLSESAEQIVGLEIVESAVNDAETNCLLNRVTNCRFILGDIKDTFTRIGFRADVLIIDPPRAGINKHAIKQILDMKPARIVYVSCNPATMARDLSMIREGYRTLEIQPVDMFPHTFHIESVARLERI